MSLFNGRTYTSLLDCDWFTVLLKPFSHQDPLHLRGSNDGSFIFPWGKKVERRDENGIIVFGKPVAINVCLEWQVVLLNLFYFDVFSFPLPGPVRAVPLS